MIRSLTAETQNEGLEGKQDSINTFFNSDEVKTGLLSLSIRLAQYTNQSLHTIQMLQH